MLKTKNEKKFDFAKVEKGVQFILEGVGENPEREGLKDTPKRVARFWKEFITPKEVKHSFFSSSYDQMIIVKEISFYSMCEHHLLPFIGQVAVGYIPSNGKVLGLSKIIRIVESHTGKLQIQERMTEDIGREIERLVSPKGIGVWVEARHLCMSLRGVKNKTSNAVTSYLSGVFKENLITREEFMKNVMGNNHG